MSGNPEIRYGERPLLDRALAGRAFTIDPMACAAAAQTIRSLRLEEENPSSSLPGSGLLFTIAVAAICHQINWDFLFTRLGRAFYSELFDAHLLSKVDARTVGGWLSGYGRPERIKASERAAFLRDVGGVIDRQFGGKADNIFEGEGHKLYGPDGFMARLDKFRAFREDPLRKKSNMLVHEIVRQGMMEFEDSNRIAPAIDYHIMRVYLRTGRVVPIHRTTLDLLKADSSPRPRLVRLLREAVAEALSLTAFYADLSIPAVNLVEWQIGRNICDRTRPRCTDARWSGHVDENCPYVSFCRTFLDPEWRLLREPDLKKSFY